MIDEKIPPSGGRYPLIACGEEILCSGVQNSGKVRADETTKTFIYSIWEERAMKENVETLITTSAIVRGL